MRVLLLILSFLFFTVNMAFALDVVYPASKEITVTTPSIYFYGNTNPKSMLKINSESVKLFDEGIFVQVVPLFLGVNNITIESIHNGKTEKQIYKVTRNKPKTEKTLPLPYVEKNKNYFLYTKTINDISTVREKPSKSSKRVIELPKGVVLYLAGKKGDFYKIEENGKTEFWIHKSNIEEPVIVSKRIQSKIKQPEYESDKFYNYTKIALSYPVMYTVEQDGKKLILTLYGVKDPNNNANDSGNLEFVFEDEDQVLGYDGFFEDDKFVLRRAKIADKINPYAPLHNIRIFIDAGHGGSEKGAIGPTRVFEKDINLSISKKLIKLLKAKGAIVSYSRIDDSKVNLYDRVDKAKENNAFISLSIHNNSLPPNKNPFITHGCEVYYYNDNAKVLAYIIKNNLARDLKIKDNGLYKSSYVLNRSTNPISVLIEVAYMINPDEYKKLRSDKFQMEVAKSITKSLEQFMILLKK